MSEFLVDQLRVHISGTRAEMGVLAGTDAAAEIRAVIGQRGGARVILASAPSQTELLDALAGADLDWSRVTIFHMDEYAGLDAQHPASFRHYQKGQVLDRIRPAAFHGIAGEARDAIAECARYAALLA